MKLSEFRKLKLNQRLWDIDKEQFTTKKEILYGILERATKTARDGYPILSEKRYVLENKLDSLAMSDEKRVKSEVDKAMKAWGLK